MSASTSQIQILLQNPLTSDLTRSVISAVLDGCTNPAVLADFVLARVHQRVAETGTGRDTACPCGCGRRLQPQAHDCRAFQAAALNAEAGDWLADLLLVPIGKRQNMLRKRAWSRNFYSGTAQFDEEIRAGLASEWQAYEDLQYLVLERDGPFCALSGAGENIVCTEIIPTSQDRGRFVSNMARGVEPTTDRVGIQDRFRILAHVFFNGEYDENLAPENVQSICNALMLSESWMARVDSGHLTFKSAGRYMASEPSISLTKLYERRLNMIGASAESQWKRYWNAKLVLST